jgi:hypothetical protein
MGGKLQDHGPLLPEEDPGVGRGEAGIQQRTRDTLPEERTAVGSAGLPVPALPECLDSIAQP